MLSSQLITLIFLWQVDVLCFYYVA